MLCRSVHGYGVCVSTDKIRTSAFLCVLDVDLVEWIDKAKTIYTLLLQYLITFQFVISLVLKHLTGWSALLPWGRY